MTASAESAAVHLLREILAEQKEIRRELAASSLDQDAINTAAARAVTIALDRLLPGISSDIAEDLVSLDAQAARHERIRSTLLERRDRDRERVERVDGPALLALYAEKGAALEPGNDAQRANLSKVRTGKVRRPKLATAERDYRDRGGDPKDIEALVVGRDEAGDDRDLEGAESGPEKEGAK